MSRALLIALAPILLAIRVDDSVPSPVARAELGGHADNFVAAGQCIRESVDLSEAGQGSICQNSFRPQTADGMLATIVLTSRTNIATTAPTDPNASGDPGSVVLTADGTGVKKTNCGSGGLAIDGQGNGKDEELIFTFDGPVRVDRIILSINQIDFADDEPVIFIFGIDRVVYVSEEPEILGAFISTEVGRGTIDFSALTTAPPGLLTTEFRIRETNGHIFVGELTVLCFCLVAIDCDDSDACTTDWCDTATGDCSNTPFDPSACDDQNECRHRSHRNQSEHKPDRLRR